MKSMKFKVCNILQVFVTICKLLLRNASFCHFLTTIEPHCNSTFTSEKIAAMRHKFTTQTVYYFILALLTVLFLHTAVSKFMGFERFAYDIKNQPFPNELTPFLAWAIPTCELGIVLSFFFERTRIIGLYGSLVLMSLFTVYTSLVLSNAFEYIPCSCGGIVKYLNWKQHLVFNIFFTTISYWGIVLHKKLRMRIQQDTSITYA